MVPTPPGLARPVASLVELLQRRADAAPELPLYTFLTSAGRERRLTTGAVASAAERVAAGLAGVDPGARALLLFAPGLEYIAALYGCLWAGVVPVPTYPPLPGRSAAPTRAIADAAAPALALTSPELHPLVAASPELRGLDVRWLTVAVPEGRAVEVRDVEPPPDLHASAPRPGARGTAGAPELLQFTSGSTANPRGVRLTAANLLANLEVIRRRFRHDADSVGVIWLPPYHDMGLVGGLLQPLYAGFPVYLMSPLDFLKRPSRWLEAVSRYRATTSGGPDFAYALAARRVSDDVRSTLDLSSWRVAFTGAERVRASSLAAFRAAFAPAGFDAAAFHPCYGLAEATLYTTGVQGVTTHPAAPDLVSCGQVADGHEVRVVAPESGRERAPDDVGEVWLRGPSVAAGYHGDPGSPRFAGRVAGAHDGPPWLRTGDLGRLRDGHLYIVGRLAARVIVRGRNLQAEDIEDVAGAASDGLRTGRGVAFTREDDGPDTRLVLVQEVRPGGGEVDPDAIVAAVQAALARALGVTLDALALVAPGAIPLTSSGKVRRDATARAWAAGELPALATWSAAPPSDA